MASSTTSPSWTGIRVQAMHYLSPPPPPTEWYRPLRQSFSLLLYGTPFADRTGCTDRPPDLNPTTVANTNKPPARPFPTEPAFKMPAPVSRGLKPGPAARRRPCLPRGPVCAEDSSLYPNLPPSHSCRWTQTPRTACCRDLQRPRYCHQPRSGGPPSSPSC